MHEMSIAEEVCRIAQEAVGTDQCCRIVEVGVELGLESGIEGDNLLFWLEILLADPPFRKAKATIRSIEGPEMAVSHLELEDELTQEDGDPSDDNGR